MKQDDAIQAAIVAAISLIRIQDGKAKTFRTKGSLKKSVTTTRCYLGGNRREYPNMYLTSFWFLKEQTTPGINQTKGLK